MAGNPHFCPQCGHVGPPKRGRLNWFGWLLVPPTALIGAAVVHVSMREGALFAARAAVESPHLSPGAVAVVTWLAGAAILIAYLAIPAALILLTRRRVCAACGWRHTRPATPSERAPAERTAP